MIKDVKRFFLYLGIAGLVLVSNTLFAQQFKLGDNLGSHKATKDIDMQSHNISTANLVAAKGAVIGTATALSNTSIALQVDGLDKAILVPRVTDLLNVTTPSIPVANALNGMIVYDLATSKFYYRQNNAWIAMGLSTDATEEFSATAAQTSFTLTQAPSVKSIVKMYINGIRISNTAYSTSGVTVTYIPANNGAYALVATDRIQFDYYY